MIPFEWPENGVKSTTEFDQNDQAANDCIVWKLKWPKMAIYSSSAIKIGQPNEPKMH